MKIIDSIQDYLSEGKFTIGKAMIVGFSVITPLFLIMSAPWLSWIAIAPEHRYDVKYNWLQDFMWIWPVCLFGVIFLSLVGWMIYNNLKDSGTIK